ncbi:type I restriction-modification system subunit M [Helicobacter pylori]|uniref:type I restriction-modification system subunit M n=2 Tax=Helicobacter pylori TaxID=210 RepID=UPI0011CD0DCF|nr:type I restriction-modification system subunit M [Helicobacter pylori]NHA86426.1 type I restriction-modification system subunit M [Helicobacter pylori]NHA90646.1 type I restriction-modification system subunit M [Helicobacter pylori]QEF24405.1 type I restriction-modification system subunit M [Helicobacter pylori]
MENTQANEYSSLERNELHNTIWKVANELRGSVDGWDFKQYVLGILFYRYISENMANHHNEYERKLDPSFDYASLSDEEAEIVRKSTIEEKGFFIPPSALFCNVLKNAPSNEDLNVTLQNIFTEIEKSSLGTPSEENVKGLFADLDVNSNKLGSSHSKRVEKLTKILQAIGGMQLGDYQQSGIDVFGDAYEYLMAMYASNAGKSGGEYFTPQEVSELFAKIALHNQESVNKVYDPCCGSGSLLLQFSKVLGDKNVSKGYFGQEINLTTYNLCRINMFLHDINYSKFHIALGDTLLDPKHEDDEPFDAIVSNPPYSTKWAGDKDPILINDERFSPAGVLAPKNAADLAFTMHMLSYLSNSGTAAIVEFPGVLYRGNAESKIREYLVKNNFIDCVIALPDNLFFGTSIATCILVLKKNKQDDTTLFIDASKEFVKEGKKNKLKEHNREKILQTYTERKAIKHFSALATMEKIQENDYNLSVNRYVEQEDTKEIIDIKALNSEISQIVEKQSALRNSLESIIKELEEGKMHKIERLLQTLAPKGVGFRKIGEICLIKRGRVIAKKILQENGKYPVYSSQTLNNGILGFIDTYDFDGEFLTWTTDGAYAGSVFYRNGRFSITNVCGLLQVIQDNILHKYLYYILQITASLHVSSGMGNPKLMSAVMQQITIPIPPLEIQQEIVKILDQFSLLTTDLLAGIPAEIKARKKQYEYYREKLLTFKPLQNKE